MVSKPESCQCNRRSDAGGQERAAMGEREEKDKRVNLPKFENFLL